MSAREWGGGVRSLRERETDFGDRRKGSGQMSVGERGIGEEGARN